MVSTYTNATLKSVNVWLHIMVSITLIFNTIVGQLSILPASDTFVDLGVRRSASGFFHDHIAMVAQKGRRLVGMCFRQLQSCQPDFLLKIYKTYVLPPIMYISQLWSPNLRYEVNALQAVT